MMVKKITAAVCGFLACLITAPLIAVAIPFFFA